MRSIGTFGARLLAITPQLNLQLVAIDTNHRITASCYNWG